ncbi:hypothetical protein BC835DRAFT_1421711 [Cytidiella melzeri]|nr:hypothetical protein BC835DRAFT_1421711 [Cytidiella melzeri]
MSAHSIFKDQIASIEIFPPIAIARVGDSQESFLAPELPGIDPLPEGGFRDAHQKIKRCAARFRLYAFDADGKVLGEVDARNPLFDITWTVHVANKKSAWVRFRGQYREEHFKLRNPTVQPWPKDGDKEVHDYAHTDTRTKLIIQSQQSVRGANSAVVPLEGEFYGSHTDPITVSLGEIRTDEAGRLIVIPSDGHAWHLGSGREPENQPFLKGPFDNNDWVDTMSDGYVTVRVMPKGVTDPKYAFPTKHRATVITAPPHYAHGHHCPTTLYELIEDVYERPKRTEHGNAYDVGEVNYYKHIDPIFRRMYMNSWTNFRANEGHGPRKATLFLDNPDLFNPKTEHPQIRRHIVDRIRAPVIKADMDHYPTAERPIPAPDPDNYRLRTEQAFMYYMPRLGGNDSDLPESAGDENNADRWTSLTQLQYDRFKKWASGDFVTGTKPTPAMSLDQIALQDQPHALTFAALEWSVGAPLYPGIECYWIAEFTEMYDLSAPFRFSDKVLPGHLSRALALPWHADFYMCNTHWWPSVRPDDIVAEDYFTNVKESFQDELHNLSLNLTLRQRWDDGLDRRPHKGDERYGNSEMVRKWHKLGFISTVNYGPTAETMPIAIEMERTPGFGRVPVQSNDPDPAPSADPDVPW